MNRLINLFLILSLILPIGSFNICASKIQNEVSQTNGKSYNAGIVNGEIEILKPPEYLTSKKEKLNYILSNFWDSVNFEDSSITKDDVFIEQNFVNYISILDLADEEDRKNAVFNLLDCLKDKEEIYDKFLALAELYLYEIDSPMLNENLYMPFLQYEIENPESEDFHRERAQWRLQMVNKNKTGDFITDFIFTDRNGEERTLYSVFPDRKVLLIFYDPDCDNCRNTLNSLSLDEGIKESVSNGNLGVVAIYSGDNNLFWKIIAENYPEKWIVGIEPGFLEEEDLYEFRKMPTIFLLDPAKKVMKKNIKDPLKIDY